MQIKRSARVNDELATNLEIGMKKIATKDYDKPADLKLGDDRDSKGFKHEEGTLELILGDDRKNEEVSIHEKMLADVRKDDKPAITEAKLNASTGTAYPHRNEKAWKRTKDKRPVNALNEEMGSAGDAGKVDRYEKASKGGEKRVVDKDIGEQRKAYNHKRIVEAKNQAEAEAVVGDYLTYKNNNSPWSINLVEAKKLDSMMATILGSASGRDLTGEEKSKIEALKRQKSEILKVAGK